MDFFLQSYPYKTKPHKLIAEIKEILKNRNPKELDRIEQLYSKINYSMFNGNELAYLVKKANIKINKASGQYTVEEKARYLIEYLKMVNIIQYSKKRNKAYNENKYTRLFYELENMEFSNSEVNDEDEDDDSEE